MFKLDIPLKWITSVLLSSWRSRSSLFSNVASVELGPGLRVLCMLLHKWPGVWPYFVNFKEKTTGMQYLFPPYKSTSALWNGFFTIKSSQSLKFRVLASQCLQLWSHVCTCVHLFSGWTLIAWWGLPVSTHRFLLKHKQFLTIWLTSCVCIFFYYLANQNPPDREEIC